MYVAGTKSAGGGVRRVPIPPGLSRAAGAGMPQGEAKLQLPPPRKLLDVAAVTATHPRNAYRRRH